MDRVLADRLLQANDRVMRDVPRGDFGNDVPDFEPKPADHSGWHGYAVDVPEEVENELADGVELTTGDPDLSQTDDPTTVDAPLGYPEIMKERDWHVKDSKKIWKSLAEVACSQDHVNARDLATPD